MDSKLNFKNSFNTVLISSSKILKNKYPLYPHNLMKLNPRHLRNLIRKSNL